MTSHDQQPTKVAQEGLCLMEGLAEETTLKAGVGSSLSVSTVLRETHGDNKNKVGKKLSFWTALVSILRGPCGSRIIWGRSSWCRWCADCATVDRVGR
eukprot:1140677-Amphidinium_carterae.1